MKWDKFRNALKTFKENSCIPWNIQSAGSAASKLQTMINSNLNIFEDKDPYFIRCLVNETLLHFQKFGEFNINREWNEIISKNIMMLTRY